jgi:hypothetical protein
MYVRPTETELKPVLRSMQRVQVFSEVAVHELSTAIWKPDSLLWVTVMLSVDSGGAAWNGW